MKVIQNTGRSGHDGVADLIARIAVKFSLSPREADVLSRAASGQSVKEVAAALNLSRKTVEYFWTRLYDKLRCRSQLEALAILLRAAANTPGICPGCVRRMDRRTIGQRRAVTTNAGSA